MIFLSDTGSFRSENDKFIYNILPVGHFYDKRYGEIWVTDEMIKQMETNFGKNPSYEVPVKLGHDYGAKSPGQVIALEAKPEGLEVTIAVDKDTSQAILDKQYRYMSAEFDSDYVDKTTGDHIGAVLKGAALVNQPAHPFVEPFKLADESEETKVAEDKKNAELEAKVKEQEAQLKEKETQLADKDTQLADMQKKYAELQAEKDKAEMAKRETEVKMFCDKWIGEGIPPVVLEQVKPVLLAKTATTIKLSDDSGLDTLKFFGDMFEKMPKQAMSQKSMTDTSDTALSDIERGKAIAECVK